MNSDALDRVLQRFPDAKQIANGWTARCPAHKDRNPSLSISIGEGDRVLLCCHAGCSVDEICSAAGIVVADLFPAPPSQSQPKARAEKKTAIKRTYATRDEAVRAVARTVNGKATAGWRYDRADGTELFWVVRYETGSGKAYRPVSRTGDRWAVGAPVGLLPLYRLARIADVSRVYVAEGEKAADALVALGLVGVTSALGARSAKRTDWSPLAGREVVIVPDNDAAGQKYASEVADILDRLAGSPVVKVVHLPNLPKAGDAVEFIEARHADGYDDAAIREEIEQLAEATKGVDRTGPTAKLVRISDVVPSPLQFLWPGRIPLGKLTILAGDPGLGKSFVTLDIAARVSTGTSWPDSPRDSNPRGDVVLLSAEDDIADTIRPRLDAAGADVTKIVAVQGVEHRGGEAGKRIDRSFSLESDLGVLEQTIREAPDCRLVVIDPVTAFLGKTDSHRNAEVRGLLAPLSELAARYQVAVLAVTHLNKSYGGKALYRAMGSLAFIAAARAGWLVTADKDDSERRFMLPVKSNLVREPTGVAYRIESREQGAIGDVGVIAWEPEPITMSADDVLAAELDRKGDGRTAVDEAAEWLRDVLAAGSVPVSRVKVEAEGAGLSWSTIRRAKTKLGVKPRKGSFGGGWDWSLDAEGAREGAEDAQGSKLGAFAQNEHLREREVVEF